MEIFPALFFTSLQLRTIFFHIPAVAEAAVIHQRRRSQPKPQIIPSLPVSDIVAALITRQGIIGNLIAVIPALPQYRFRQFVHLPLLLLRRQQMFRIRPIFSPLRVRFCITLIKGRPFLYDKAVCGNMLRTQSRCFPKRSRITLHTLTGQGRHQIHIDITKAGFSRQIKGFQKILPGMYPPELFKFLIPHGLQADAEPVEPCLPQFFQIRTVCRARIALQRDLRSLRGRQIFLLRDRKAFFQLI